MSDFSLTRQDTLVMKGIAIIAMLFHHLYGWPPEGVEAYSGFLLFLGDLGKICVSIFLFCSGYGLAKQYRVVEGWKDTFRFMARRFVKFYANYWVIFLIFVPIGVYVFHRPLSAAYGENVNIFKRLLIDLAGMQGYQSYNITWWFNQLIIILYLLFPLLYRLTKKIPWLMIVLSASIISIKIEMPYIPEYLCTWQFSFVVGIVWQLYEDKAPKIATYLSQYKYVFSTVSMMFFGAFVLLRSIPSSPVFVDIRIDAFLSIAIALIMLSVLRNLTRLTNVFSFLGKHSINIYLIHTFFNLYWFSEWFHTNEWMRNGGNFVILTMICLLISIVIERLKDKIGLYKLEEKIIKRI